jgi:hypothetical protein
MSSEIAVGQATQSEASPSITATEAFQAGTNPSATDAPKLDDSKTEQMSSAFAALTRKEKSFREQQAKFKTEQEQLAPQLAEYRKWKEDQDKLKAKKSPIEALMEHGYSYEDAANYVINDNRPTPELIAKEAESKVDKFIREQKEREEKKLLDEKSASVAAEAKATEDFKAGIADFISKEADAYEYINLYGQQALVFDTISAHYEKTLGEGKPVVLSTKEAADLVENYLAEQFEMGTKTKKFQAKQKPSDEANKNNESGAVHAFTSKTLSNSATATSSSTQNPARSDAERERRALALLGG